MLDYIKIILLLITCFIILITLLKLRSKNIRGNEWRFLLSSLFLTLFLAFIIEIKPHHIIRANFNIPNTITYLFYFVIVGSYFFIYRKILLRFKYVLIIISFVFFGFANAVDLLSDGQLFVLAYNEIIEDVFHVLGIAFWLFFFIDFSKMTNKINNYK
jgi:hypothetical protein